MGIQYHQPLIVRKMLICFILSSFIGLVVTNWANPARAATTITSHVRNAVYPTSAASYQTAATTQHSVDLQSTANIPIASSIAVAHFASPAASVSVTPSFGLSGPWANSTIGMNGQVGNNPTVAVGNGSAFEMMVPWVAVYSVNPITHRLTLVPHTTKTINTFFGVTSKDVFDNPEVFYDPGTGRYFAAAIDLYTHSTFTQSFVLATSKTSNPAGAWTITIIPFMQYNLSGMYMDTLGFGFDSKGIYLTAHTFLPTGETQFHGMMIGGICKFYLISGNAADCGKLGSHFGYFLGLREFDGLADHVMPALTYNSLAAELFIDVDTKTTCYHHINTYCHYTVWALSDMLNTALLSGVTYTDAAVSGANTTTDAQGNGVAASYEFIDAAPVWRAGALYVSLSSAVNHGSSAAPDFVPAIVWYALVPTLVHSSKCPNCVVISRISNLHVQLWSFGTISAFNPSQMVDNQGDVCFTYNVAGSINPTTAMDCLTPSTLMVVPSAPHLLAMGTSSSSGGYTYDTVTAWDPASCVSNGCHGFIGVGMYTKPYGTVGATGSVFGYALITS